MNTNPLTKAATALGPVDNRPDFLLSSADRRLRQNWVLDPLQDTLLIIAAPLISLALALIAMQHYGAQKGAVLVITAHIILTVAHHMPTFIRIYGDVELFRRFKWSFLLGPVIPLVFSAAVLTYLNLHQYPVEYFLYLYIFLSLWDPWHFLRQHFGFMRIYDRHNQAPRAIASNMDWAICGVWFVHIMIASADWIPGLLEDLYRSAHMPVLLVLPTGVMDFLRGFSWWAAVLTTGIYTIYLAWCVRRGFYLSFAKLALLICTFGVMYFTYTPNVWMAQLVPEWSFKVGFATVGIVHMTQYLAIVWRYDRRIAEQGRARTGVFSWLHSRSSRWGIGLAALGYTLFCVAYGDFITTQFDNRWLMSCLLAVGFTSTLMHYYFDGFIWRMRHSQNSNALVAAETEKETSSWWNSGTVLSPGNVLIRQLIYFGLPMAALTWGALHVWQGSGQSYIQQMYRAQMFSQQGEHAAAAEEARKAYASMRKEIPLAEKLLELKASAANQAQLAFLLYNESLYRNQIMPALDGIRPSSGNRQDHMDNVRRAVELMEAALQQPTSLAHPGRDQLTHADAEAIAKSWRRQLLN